MNSSSLDCHPIHGSWTHLSQPPKRHLNQFTHFCTADSCALQTQADTRTMLHATSVAIGRVLCTACKQCGRIIRKIKSLQQQLCSDTCLMAFFSSTSSSWPNKVGLKCPSARPYVRPSTKTLFDFNEICYVGRGWYWRMTVWSMTRSKVQVKVTSPWKSEIWPFARGLSPPPFTMGAGKWPQILKLGHNT